jgi:hypothetical protein
MILTALVALTLVLQRGHWYFLVLLFFFPVPVKPPFPPLLPLGGRAGEKKSRL